jgi:hypothetical protein
MLHVQIGPSPLALGLLVPCTLNAGFDVILLGRPGGSGCRRYIHESTSTGQEVEHCVAAFEGPDRLADLSSEARARIESEEPMLLTCTLRGAIAGRRPLVEELLDARPHGAETVFVPCENSPSPIYGELEKRCGSNGAVSLRSMINRMCAKGPPDSKGRRTVRAHPKGEWLLERPPRPVSLLEVLSSVEEVDVVEDLAAREDRKLWMVNGTHLALALTVRCTPERDFGIEEDARPDGTSWEDEGSEDDMRSAARRPEVIARLSHLHGPMDDALRHEHPGLEGNLDYGLEHVLAYMEHPDSAARVLSGFRRQDLAPFIETMEERLGRPAAICHAMGRSVEAFEHVLDVLEDVVADPDAFVDAAEIRENPDLVTQAADARAIEAYQRFIHPWMSPAEAEQRADRFTTALRDSNASSAGRWAGSGSR